MAHERDDRSGPDGRPGPRPRADRQGSVGGLRVAIERRSAAPLLFLRRLPRWVPPVVLAALLVAGLAAEGWPGASLLLLLAVVLAWLGYLSWPRLTPPGRLLRVAALLVLFVLILGDLGIKP